MTRRIGIAGCGGIARTHLAAYLAAGARVVRVYDPVPAAAERFAAECGAKAVASIEALAAPGIDAASVCSPPGAHPAACLALLAAGIPTLVEKPLAADLAGARTVADAARAARAPLMVGFCHRHHGPVIELARLIASGELGAPVYLRIVFAGPLQLAGGHRADPAIAGGGCVADNGTHAVDLFRHLVGDIAEVRGLIANVVQQAAVEDVGVIALRATSGALGEITTTFSGAFPAARLELSCTGGAATIGWWDEDLPPLRFRRAGEKAWTIVDCAAHPDRFTTQIARFLACVASGERPSPSAEDGLATATAIAAAYASARTALAGAARG
ncbi:MAG TPA: Gfo/Idh/MocA family oxidoreductase [Planctomycetota bacterium]|nr:Gfo/Idh/MocA family oxidoreductase [Planctomycetota bacterium]